MNIQRTNSRTADKFLVRLPDGMRERIAEVAHGHHRSMSSEIIARLARSLEGEDVDGNTFAVYLPESVRAEIEPLAQDNDRSLIGELLYRLKRLTTTDKLADDQGRMIGILQRRIEELESQLQMKGAA